MLDPNKNRFDYGEQLNAPNGYELSAAIATTYSIDLDALLAISVALGLNDTLEGDLQGEKLVLLEAIGKLKDKLIVFYQKGKIKIPTEYNHLFTLLEPCLVPVVPEGGVFASFHPKLWLLRYKEKDKSRNPDILYKLIVLTRNLTFDRSWDVAVSLDGKLVQDKTKVKEPWIDFILELLDDQSNGFKKIFKNELQLIKWEYNFGRNEKLLPGGNQYKRPLDLRKADSMMVVSPFIKDSGLQVNALDWLGKHVKEGGEKLLFSRSEELNAIGSNKLNGWECYSINPDVVDGEEKTEEGYKEQNLHAKIIITEHGNVTDWHLGSANATSAALGDFSSDTTRNTEFMIRFSGATEKLGITKLLDHWVGQDIGKGLFTAHKFDLLQEAKETQNSSETLRRVIFDVINAQWKLTAQVDENSSHYALHLEVTSEKLFDLFNIHEIAIEVEHLAIPGNKVSLMAKMEWLNVQLTQISAFIVLHIRLTNLPEEVEKILIQTDLQIIGGDKRYQGILEKLLDSEDKILNYIRMLLNPLADKNDWLSHDINQSKEMSGVFDVFDAHTPMFEQLMLSASRNPVALRRIETIIRDLEESQVRIPDQFNALWKHFRSGVK